MKRRESSPALVAFAKAEVATTSQSAPLRLCRFCCNPMPGQKSYVPYCTCPTPDLTIDKP